MNRSPAPDTEAVAPNDGPAQCGDCDFRPPIEEVCGCCGAKHYGPFTMCSRCQNALNRGE